MSLVCVLRAQGASPCFVPAGVRRQVNCRFAKVSQLFHERAQRRERPSVSAGEDVARRRRRGITMASEFPSLLSE